MITIPVTPDAYFSALATVARCECVARERVSSSRSGALVPALAMSGDEHVAYHRARLVVEGWKAELRERDFLAGCLREAGEGLDGVSSLSDLRAQVFALAAQGGLCRAA